MADLKIAMLVDTFVTQDTTKWAWGPAAVQSYGAAHLSANEYSLNSSVVATDRYDLSASAIFFQLPKVPSTRVGTDGPFFTFELFQDPIQDSGDRYLRWFYYSNSGVSPTVSALYANGAGEQSPFAAAYSAVDHSWLKIAHDGMNIVWSTSADGVAWDVRAAVAAGAIGLTWDDLGVAFRASADVANTGTFDIDNVNTRTAAEVEHCVSIGLGPRRASVSGDTMSGHRITATLEQQCHQL